MNKAIFFDKIVFFQHFSFVLAKNWLILWTLVKS